MAGNQCAAHSPSVTSLLCVAHLLVDISSIVLLTIGRKHGKELLKILLAESR
jgi:hypothetical protein